MRKLTKAQQAAQVAAGTLTGADRWKVHARQSGYSLRDHENAEWVADRDGVEIMDYRDAMDLRREYLG